MKRVLVVAVHPDDETLGCGGTLLRLGAENSTIHWLIVTSIYTKQGEQYWTMTSRSNKAYWNHNGVTAVPFSAEAVVKRSEEIKQVGETYAFDSVHELGLPTMCLDQLAIKFMIAKISEVLDKIKPDTVILPFKGDVHSDHRIIFRAAYSCTKSYRYPYIKKVIMMETISETDFAAGLVEERFCPNLFVDISKYINQKQNIMRFYESELGDHPFPRSKENIKALAINRGAIVGFRYAESFMVLREKW